MPNHVVHFAIHADDLARAQAFYESVFGWTFEPWGPPDFFMIRTGPPGDSGIHGSLQKRRETIQGRGMIGFECTIGVESVDRAAEAIRSAGGELATPKITIPTVGWLIQFQDPEGNVVNIMQYDENAG